MAQELIDKIREQAQARGLDPDIAVQIARAESSLDPSAKAKTSSAQGLFQVIDKTWKEHGGKPGKKTDVDENIRVGLNVLQANQKALRETLGRDPSASELYAAHFLGATGAKGVLLASDDTPVSQLLSERAVRANPGLLKDKNVGQLRAALEAKMTMPGSRPTAQAPAPVQAPMPAAAAGAPKRPTIPSSKIAANQLGTGYQAALALSFLADEDEDTPLTREQWQERQDQTTAADMLAGYKSKNALSEINWDESALFPAQPVKMAEGGEVEAVASDEQKFHQGQPLPQTDTLVGRAPYRSAQEQLSLLEAMNPGVVINERPLAPGLYGYVRGSAPDVLNISTQQSPAQAEQTRLHEMEHSLDFRGGDILGRPGVGRTDQAYRAYYLLNKDWSPIRQFTENVANSREKLEQFFGMPMTSGYLRMSPEERKSAKDKGGRDALIPYFDEQLASLSALEQVTGKSITRDPEMRKLFPNTKMMAVYDALTGLRQTRLDARDLPPHTPLPSYTYETNPVVRFIREKTTGPKEYGIPIKRADGGDVDLEKLQNEARQGEAYRQMEQYLKARDAMPDIVVKKLPEPINAQFTAMRMPAGSGRIEVHKDPDVLRVIGPSVMAHELAHAAERQMGQQASEESSVFGGKSQFAEAYDKLVGRGPFVSGKKRAEFARKIAPDWAAFNREYRASPIEIGAHGVGAFAPSKNMQDSAPLHVDATAATEFQILLDLAQRNAKNRATGAVRIPNFLKQVLGFADGGEVEPTPEELAAAARPAFVTPKSGIGRRNTTKPGEIEAAVLQGVSEMPYNLVGSVADVGALALRPFGYTNPTPFLGSEHLKQLATRAGVRQAPPTQPTARAFYELGQFGSSLVNPAAPVRAAAAAGQTAARTAQQAMQDFQAYNRQLAAPGASYAVKPKGGVFAMTTEPSATAATKSDLDELLKSYMSKAETKAPEGSREAVMEFLRTKAPKYFTTTYGTASDPLREALRSVRVEPIGREASKMPPYMIDAARDPQARGHAQAAIDLERAYDEMTGISGMAYTAPGREPIGSGSRARQMLEAMTLEGVPVEARNPAFVTVHQAEDFQRYPSSSRIMRELVEQQGTLPPHLQQALRTEETIYDVKPGFDMLRPENVVDALSAVPSNKLKNMSFPEALVQGLQATAPLRDYKAAIEIAGRGGAVPPAALMKFTEPVTPTTVGQWVRLTDPLATKMEGKLLNHSVGGYAEGESYGTAYTGLPYGGKKAFEEGLAQVYSLRDKSGKPMVTVEVANKGTKEEPKLVVTQVRGRFNSEPPENARGAVFDLLDKLDDGGKLKEVRPNSYSVSSTGERLDQGSMVDWGREYDLWKAQFEE